MPKPKVYVVNKSGHDLSDAERFGDLVYLTTGRQKLFNAHTQARRFAEIMADSSPDDYLLLTSLNVLCSLATAILIQKHGKLNLLLWISDEHYNRHKRYVAKTIDFRTLIEAEEEKDEML